MSETTGDRNVESMQGVPPFEVQGAVVRTFAFLVDILVVLTAVLVIYYILGIPINKDSDSIRVVYPVVFFLYMLLMEGESGQTIGKKFFNIKVVALDGSPLSFGGVFIRNIIGIFERSLIGVIVICLNKRKQRLGDMAAKSLVVRFK